MMKFTVARHLSQICILLLFLIGNLGLWAKFGLGEKARILEGDLSTSQVLGLVHLSDPLAVIQLFLAGFSLSSSVVIGAIIVFIFYALIAPRAFCGWVCPVNLITDLAYYLRQKCDISKNLANISPKTRYYLLALSLIISAIFGIAAWESVSFVGSLTRSVVFASSFAVFLSGSFLAIFVAIVVVDMFVGKRFICGHLCPLGAFYSIISKFSLIRIKYDLDKCTKCGKCKEVCPEISPLADIGKTSSIVGSECISCGRCVEVCNDDALNFSILNFGGKK